MVFGRLLRAKVNRQVVGWALGNQGQADDRVDARLCALRSVYHVASENNGCLNNVSVVAMRLCGLHGRYGTVLASIVRAPRGQEGVHYAYLNYGRYLASEGCRDAVYASAFTQRMFGNLSAFYGTERLRCSVQVRNYRFFALFGRTFVINDCRLNARVTLRGVASIRVILALILRSFSAFFYRGQEVDNGSIRCTRIVNLPGLFWVYHVGGGLRSVGI